MLREVVLDVMLVKRESAGVIVLYTQGDSQRSKSPSTKKRHRLRTLTQAQGGLTRNFGAIEPNHHGNARAGWPSNRHFAVNGTRFPVNGNVQIMRAAALAASQTKAVGGTRRRLGRPFDSVIASLVCTTPDLHARRLLDVRLSHYPQKTHDAAKTTAENLRWTLRANA
jgi:hypothetical protein